MNKNIISKAASIMNNAKIATIAAVDANGYPRASTISNVKTEGVKTIWFSSGFSSHKLQCFINNNKASVCYHVDGENITLVGDIEILTDLETKKQFWDDSLIAHFPGGVTDSDFCILKFTTREATFWINNQYIVNLPASDLL